MKIQEGCDRYCAYCIIPSVRGGIRSRPLSAIAEEAAALAQAGFQELVLTGIHLTSYGRDLDGKPGLAEAVKAACVPGVSRIRLGSLEPRVATEAFAQALSECAPVCPQFHLALQSGSDAVLRRMKRCYNTEQFRQAAARLRTAWPLAAFTTDVIVGFPGETEEEFEETCSLVEQVGYDSAFTFIYSPRVGTRAADMPDQIPEEVSSRRIQKLIALQKDVTHKRYANYIGQVHSVLVEESSRRDENQMAGKNEYNITVNFPGDKSLIGQIVRVKITSAGESTLRGERVE